MSKEAFANTIIQKMNAAIGTSGASYGNSTATSAMNAVAEGITEYLIANTQVTVKYLGIISSTPPSPDPLLIDTFKIVGVCAPPSVSSDFASWLLQIENNIISGFSLAPMGNEGLVFPQKPFLTQGITLTQGALTSAHDVNDSSPQQKIWEIICDSIMQWVNGIAINKTPGMATHPSVGSSGNADIIKIELT